MKGKKRQSGSSDGNSSDSSGSDGSASDGEDSEEPDDPDDFDYEDETADLIAVSDSGQCPSDGEETSEDGQPPSAGTCDVTFECDTDRWPNVCNNARSAIEERQYTSNLTYLSIGQAAEHYVKPWEISQ